MTTDIDQRQAEQAMQDQLRALEADAASAIATETHKPIRRASAGWELYAIDQNIAHVLDKSEDGEIRDEDLLVLDALEMDRKELIGGIVACIRNDEARATAIGAEVARLMALMQPCNRRAERLKGYLFASMKQHGEKSVDLGALGKPRIQANGGKPAVKVADTVDVRKLPVAFQRVIVELDREAVLAAHKAGESLPEGIEVSRGEHLRLG